MENLVEKLIKQIEQGKRAEYLYFYQETEVPYGAFSQWHPSVFTDGGKKFTTAEQYMMAQKAIVFNDKQTLKSIMRTESPMEIKKLGRAVANYDEAVWDKLRYPIVKTGSMLKFNQNQRLKNLLLNTGDKILAEASPNDNVWGIGMIEADENASNPRLWKGSNLLGFALMEVRDELKKNGGAEK